MSRKRVTVATAAVMVVVFGSLAVLGNLGGVAGFVLGAILVPLFASPVEWCVHRFVYHEPVFRPLKAIFTVHTAHHYAFFPTRRYVTNGPARRLAIRNRAPDIHISAMGNARVRLAHWSWYMAFAMVLLWVPAWFLTRNGTLIVGMIASSCVVANLFIVVHDTIHRPGSHRIVEAQPWYAFLDNHHYVHHVDLGVNLNFLLPLADWMFGTLRRTLTSEELAAHGSLDDAKRTRVGNGERARDSAAAG
ncbi:MAG: hypothetical protein AB7L13_17820 [Acidimicrobiia bacterium]